MCNSKYFLMSIQGEFAAAMVWNGIQNAGVKTGNDVQA